MAPFVQEVSSRRHPFGSSDDTRRGCGSRQFQRRDGRIRFEYTSPNTAFRYWETIFTAHLRAQGARRVSCCMPFSWCYNTQSRSTKSPFGAPNRLIFKNVDATSKRGNSCNGRGTVVPTGTGPFEHSFFAIPMLEFRKGCWYGKPRYNN